MKLLSPAISSLARMRMWRIDAWKNNPIEAQRDVLQNLVTAAQYTEFGRQYNFSELFTLRAFKEAVPIHDYEDMKPYIDRILNGEQNVSIMVMTSVRLCKGCNVELSKLTTGMPAYLMNCLIYSSL